jgi:hypothetical protein
VIETSTVPGDLVLAPFGGSGTTYAALLLFWPISLRIVRRIIVLEGFSGEGLGAIGKRVVRPYHVVMLTCGIVTHSI